MSKCNEKEIRCQNCDKLFNITMWDSVNVKLDPSLRERLIFKGDFFEYTCPHCGEKHTLKYPFLYHDMDHKFMISCGPLSHVIKFYESNKTQAQKLNESFGNLFENYTFCGATAVDEIIEKIIILENDLDYRIAIIYKILFAKYIKENVNKEVHSCNFYYKNDKLCLLLFNKDGKVVNTYGISREFYDHVYNKYIDNVNKVFSFVFDEAMAIKLLKYDDKEIKEALNYVSYFAVVELENGTDHFASTLPDLINNYKQGDKVLVATPNGFTYKGFVTIVYKMNYFEAPIFKDDSYTIISELRDVELTTTKNSDEDLNNEFLLNGLLEYKKNNSLPNDLIWESDAILGLRTSFSFNIEKQLSNGDIEIGEILKPGNYISPDEIITEIETISIQDNDFMCVYLSKKDMDENVGGYTYKLNDILEYALFRTDCKGVVINPNSDKIVIPTSKIFKSYLHERYMLNFERMKLLLKSFDNKDIEYIIKKSYENICKVYFEEKGPKEISEELNETEKNIGDSLDIGYKYMIELLRSKYIFRNTLFHLK